MKPRPDIAAHRSIWIGIDFSGSHLQWRQSRAVSAVWIARVAEARRSLVLRDLLRPQDLPGAGTPFERLVHFLQTAEFAVAGIDAPFAPPAGFTGSSRPALLSAIRALPCGTRPFPAGEQLVMTLAPEFGPRGRHLHRTTEEIWRRRGINVRSVLWNGPRGGAPLAAACLRLIGSTGLPSWPWASPGTGPVLAEVFPAAQLKTWDLPYYGYNGDTRAAWQRRRVILAGILRRSNLAIAARFRPTLAASADALDSVVCALAARAVSTGALAEPPDERSKDEGWIAVHR